jgi:tetratricopeptide (TPR) repeat protein
MHGDRAEAAAGGGSIEEHVTERKKAVEAALNVAGVSEKTAHSAQSYIQLGLAEYQADSCDEAVEHLQKALEICDSMGPRAAHPVLRAAALDGLARTYHRQGRYNESRASGEQALEIYEQSKEGMPSMDGLLELNLNIADLQLALRRFGDAVMTVEQTIGSIPGGRNAWMTARLYRVHAAAMIGGKSAQASASVKRAAQALENPAIPAGHRQDAYAELAALASELWEAGSDEAAIRLARRACECLAALGAPADLLNRSRLSLAAMLTRSGQQEEASAILTSISGVTAPSLRKALLEESGELHLRNQEPEEALASYSELLELAADPKEAASVQVSLAIVHEAMRNGEQAAQCAREACNTLVPLEHHDAADALFALSRAMWAAGDENAELYFEEGRRILGENESLSPANKARLVESAIPRFEAATLSQPASQLKRDAAQMRSSFKPVVLAATRVSSESEEAEEAAVEEA